MPAAINAANEVAVEAFLAGRVRFTDIPRIIGDVMEAHHPVVASSLEPILHADAWARQTAALAVSSIAAGALTLPGGNETCPTR